MRVGSSALPESDSRYLAVRHGDLHYEFPHYATLAEWEQRATWLREHIWVTLGLWPQPERSALHARVTARLDEDDYYIENVCFGAGEVSIAPATPTDRAAARAIPRHPEPPRPLGAGTDGP